MNIKNKISDKISNNKNISSSSLKAIFLVVLCTIMTSAGQVLWKLSTKNINSFFSAITNPLLILGFVCYGVGAVLLILALKRGNLSVLYPIVALSFVWVTIVSIFLFSENVNVYNWLGVLAILFGVSLIGYGSSRGAK